MRLQASDRIQAVRALPRRRRQVRFRVLGDSSTRDASPLLDGNLHALSGGHRLRREGGSFSRWNRTRRLGSGT